MIHRFVIIFLVILVNILCHFASVVIKFYVTYLDNNLDLMSSYMKIAH